jgi:hypothetical protein
MYLVEQLANFSKKEEDRLPGSRPITSVPKLAKLGGIRRGSGTVSMVMMGIERASTLRSRGHHITDIILITSRAYYVVNISHGFGNAHIHLPTYPLDLSVLPHHERE